MKIKTESKKFSKNGFAVLLLDLLFVAAGIAVLIISLLDNNETIKETIKSTLGK